jgi:hypothetical protein
VKVFLSDGHRDGAGIARRLRDDLDGDGFAVWQDETDLVAGNRRSEAIEAAINTTDYVLALCSGGSFRSPICRGEQLRAFRPRNKLIPATVGTAPDFPIFLEEITS